VTLKRARWRSSAEFEDVAVTSSGLRLNDYEYNRNLDMVQQEGDGTTLADGRRCESGP
jgi:hypothetical protein